MIHELIDEVNAVIDGEIVAVDADGQNSFEALQQRMNLVNPREIDRARDRIPVSLVVFDLLWLDGRDVTGLPLEKRRELPRLRRGGGRHGCSVTTHVVGEGTVMFEAAKAQQLEGVVAKRLGLPVRAGASHRRVAQDQGPPDPGLRRSSGFTPGQGGRGETFGALLVGAYDDGELRWVGQVGSGFTDALLAGVLEQLGGLVRDEPAGRGAPFGARAPCSSSRSSSARSRTSR